MSDRQHIVMQNRAEQPYQHATYHTNMLLAERAWSKTDLLNSTDDLTVESLQSFIPFLFSQLHLEFLFHGNVTKEVIIVDLILACSVLIDWTSLASHGNGEHGRIWPYYSFRH